MQFSSLQRQIIVLRGSIKVPYKSVSSTISIYGRYSVEKYMQASKCSAINLQPGRFNQIPASSRGNSEKIGIYEPHRSKMYTMSYSHEYDPDLDCSHSLWLAHPIFTLLILKDS